MQSIRRTLFAFLFLFGALPAAATTYYIDFAAGVNTNNGTSKSTPWKTHPYMQTAAGCTTSGSAPAYAHSVGDVFIFKQGSSWPNACFDMVLAAGGSSGNPDIYTFDPTWGSAGGTTGNTGQAVGTYQFTAGGSVINGSDGINRFVYVSGVSYITFNGVELTGMTWTGSGGSYGNESGFQFLSNTNVIVSNAYCHGWTHSGATSDALSCFRGYAYSPYGTGIQVTGSVCDGTGASDSGECTASIPLIDNSIAENMSNGLLSGYNSVVHDNQVGPINASFDASDHENCFEPIVMPAGLTSTNYFYNNVWHDCTAVGILTQGAAPSSGIEKDYLWNNVAYVGSTSMPPIPMQFDSQSTPNTSSEVHAWNNTIVGGSGGVCMRTVGRGNGNFAVLDLQNNHCISDVGTFTNGQTGNTFTNIDNLLMSLATAAAQGYTSAETYAYSPTAGGNSTVGAGGNLTSLASGATATLARDSGYGGIRPTDARPASGAWDAGAYEFTSGSPAPVTHIVKSHSGIFTQGQTGATYTITVSNTGSASTSGTVTVTDTVPTGLILVSMAGSGWTCISNVCTRADALAPSASYPSLTLTVNVSVTSGTPVVNSATVSGGGSGSNTANDSTVVNPSGGGGGGGGGPIMLVQTASGDAPAGAATATFGSNVTAHDTLIYMCGEIGTLTNPRIAITDNNGNTLTLIAFTNSTGDQSGYWYIVKNANAGATTVTCTPNGAAVVNLIVMEYSGIDNVNPIDVQSEGAESSGTTAQPGSITTTFAPDQIITFLVDNAPHTYMVDSGFTIQVTETGSNGGLVVADLNSVMVTTINPTWTASVGGTYRFAFIVALRQATGPGSRHRILETKNRKQFPSHSAEKYNSSDL